MKLKIIYLDVDGVLANFHVAAIIAHLHLGPLKLIHGTYYETNDAYRIASNEYWPNGISLQKYLNIQDIEYFWKPINPDPLFWRGLPPYPWYKRLVDICSGYCEQLVLCTSPSNHHHSWGGKALWLAQKELGHLPCIMMNGATNGTAHNNHAIGKWMLAHPDRLLIDDFHKQVDPFVQAGGKGILFPQPWNSNHPYKSDPVGYVVQQLEKITEE
jgi:hypothetical protein